MTQATEPARRRGPSSCVPLAVAAAVLSGCEPQFPASYVHRALGGEPPAAVAATPPEEQRPPGLTENLPPPVTFGWDSIQARDTLVAILTFNSTGYFVYRGEPMGYEYELLQAFVEDHDLELRVQVAGDRRHLFRMLNRGEGDVVAARLVAREEYRAHVGVTQPLYDTRPVVVQRVDDTLSTSAQGERQSPPDRAVELRARLLQKPSDLAGKEVHVPEASDYYSRIVELSDSLGEEIELVEVEQAELAEPLIEAVAEGAIRLTVSDENLAELSTSRFQNIVATPVVGDEEPVVWAVRRNAPELRRELDAWLSSQDGQTLAAILYRKYYQDRKGYLERTEDEYFATETGRISPYDSLLAKHAAGLGWDWRLLAAQVAQESRFDPRARSWAGARGLLQLMPRTAREMGVSNPTDPEDNVAGGVRYLQWLTGLWEDEVADPDERLKFVLASYNAGRGHVLDAQRLAEKHGDNPKNWEDVAYWLLQKSKRNVYRDPVVRHGYVRGIEPVQYVSKILKRYETYQGVQ